MIKFGCKKNALKLYRVGSRLNTKVNKKLSVFIGRGSTTSRHIRLSRTSKHKKAQRAKIRMIPVLLITFAIILIKKETSSWLKRTLP